MAGAASSVYEEDFNRLVHGLRAGRAVAPRFPAPGSPSAELSHREVEEDFEVDLGSSSELGTPQPAPEAEEDGYEEDDEEEERDSKESSSPLPIPAKAPGSTARSPPLSSLPSFPPVASSFAPPKPISPIYLAEEEEEVAAPAKKPPTLRFHEAEDAGDASYVASWERKIAKALSDATLAPPPPPPPPPPTVSQELDQLRKVFSPMDSVLFKVLQEAPPSPASLSPYLAAVACLAVVLLAAIVKAYM